MLDYIIFFISLATLIYGADLIINQSGKIALKFGISEYIIGATLIALGTSLPEMAASISASLNNKAELAVSNIIGSNIFNITLVLALVLVIAKRVNPKRDFFAKDSSWALFPVLILVAISLNNSGISRFTGFAMVSLMGAYILFLISSNSEALLIEEEKEGLEKFSWIKTLFLLVTGFLLVVYGADYTVESASNIAKKLGVSEWFVGVILVAIGTSMPELVVSIVAALKNRADMAIGNIIGSNMANISIALGLAAIANPININFHNYTFDIAVMVIATFMLVFITANKMYTKPAGISLLILLSIFFEHTLKSF
ncbi:MAG: calcium/sodium antiporter, partial [Epsilonproteobacteria bacterium]|nr:calcium/sodium antiporter [Campylobacterota bacterium]